MQKCSVRLWNPFVLSNLARIAGGQTRIGLWSYSMNKADGGAGGGYEVVQGRSDKEAFWIFGQEIMYGSGLFTLALALAW